MIAAPSSVNRAAVSSSRRNRASWQSRRSNIASRAVATTGSHLYPSGGLGEGRLVGSRPGAAEVAAPGLAPLRQIGGFICLVSLTLAALMHMLLRTYDRTIWRAFWFGNPEQHPPRSILRRRD